MPFSVSAKNASLFVPFFILEAQNEKLQNFVMKSKIQQITSTYIIISKAKTIFFQNSESGTIREKKNIFF